MPVATCVSCFVENAIQHPMLENNQDTLSSYNFSKHAYMFCYIKWLHFMTRTGVLDKAFKKTFLIASLCNCMSISDQNKAYSLYPLLEPLLLFSIFLFNVFAKLTLILYSVDIY